jgi:hypothetical protein
MRRSSYVRFTPNRDCKSGYLRFVMSALPPKADMCGATRDVRYGPKATSTAIRSPRQHDQARKAAF